MFLENDKIKKDSLFLKGAEVAKYSILNDSLFKSTFNETIGDDDFKMLSALSVAPKELVPDQCIGGQQTNYGILIINQQ